MLRCARFNPIMPFQKKKVFEKTFTQSFSTVSRACLAAFVIPCFFGDQFIWPIAASLEWYGSQT
eukprot:6098214-Amphidinium_carterae.1